jgi:hypothetical protein
MTPAISSPRLRLALLVSSVALSYAVGPPEVRMALAYISPFLVLLGFLLADRYPGERLIVRPRRPARPRRAHTARPPAVGFAALVPRGSGLLAFALAGRAPPERPSHPGPLQISL